MKDTNILILLTEIFTELVSHILLFVHGLKIQAGCLQTDSLG